MEESAIGRNKVVSISNSEAMDDATLLGSAENSTPRAFGGSVISGAGALMVAAVNIGSVLANDSPGDDAVDIAPGEMKLSFTTRSRGDEFVASPSSSWPPEWVCTTDVPAVASARSVDTEPSPTREADVDPAGRGSSF